MATADKPRRYKASEQQRTPGPLNVKSHRDLLRFRGEISKRVKDNPELARLLVLNPVVAFEEMGVQVSPSMRHHILTTVQHPTDIRKRREELEKKLTEELGRTPHPNDPEWVSHVLFEQLKLKPLKTEGLSPAYQPTPNEVMLKRLNNLRPPSRKRYDYPSNLAASRIQLRPWQSSLRHLDLNAAVPKTKTSRVVPKQVTLQDLFFYKDINPVAHDLLELGMIQRRSFNFQSRATLRKIKEGKKDNALYRWVKSVRFPEERPK